MLQNFQSHKATFILSLLGFIGSLIFYYTVLLGIEGGTVEEEILQRLDSIEYCIQPSVDTTTCICD